MRLGILGGSFDPVHYGHLLLAESCREGAGLDRVWFLPAAIPPHKQRQQLASGTQRAEMLELAIAGHPGFAVCTYEIDRGGVNYTVDTLSHLKNEDPSRELFFLMGGDSLEDLPGWKDPVRLCELATPLVVCRTNDVSEPLNLIGLERILASARIAEIRNSQVTMPRIDLSSTDIRQRVATGRSIRFRMPRAVEKYIETHGVYRTK